MLSMGLASVLALAGCTLAGLPVDALSELVWPVVLLTGSALGANVGEHWSKRGNSQERSQLVSTKTPHPVVRDAAPSDSGGGR